MADVTPPATSTPGCCLVTIVKCESRSFPSKTGGKPSLLFTLIGDKGTKDKYQRQELLIAQTWHRNTGEALQNSAGRRVVVTYTAAGRIDDQGRAWPTVEIDAVDPVDPPDTAPAPAPAADDVDRQLQDAPDDTTAIPF